MMKFGERIASDFVVVSKSSDGMNESYVQVVRDEYSGYISAFPVVKHDTDTVTRNLLAFLGPSYHSNTVIMCKTVRLTTQENFLHHVEFLD